MSTAPGAVLASLLFFSLESSGSGAETICSPDGKVVVTVELQEGRPSWTVAHSGHEFLRNGLLGMETPSDNFSGTYQLIGTATTFSDTTCPAVWGDLSEIRDHFNQLTVKLQEATGRQRVLHIVLRAQIRNSRMVTAEQDTGRRLVCDRVTRFRS